jgi:hypothetical protein
MSNIDQIKDRLAEAKNATRLAKEAEAALAKELQEAINAESGLVGHVLKFTLNRGFGRTARVVTKRILVDHVRDGWRGVEAHGLYVIANGSVGKMRGYVQVDKATDLGLFSALPLNAEGGDK